MWTSIWHLDPTVAEKVLRSVLVYGFLIVAMRLVGKRELGQMNTLDLVVLLLIANAVQNGIIGNDISVTGAFIGAGVLFAANEGLNRIGYLWPWAGKALEGSPSYLIRRGELDRHALLVASISVAELEAMARRQGYSHLAEVKTAILETNGAVSMFKTDVSLSEDA